jgi:hypothetical protein
MYTKNNNIPSPDFIKIDIEGHEFFALEGASQTLKESRPVLFIEIARNLVNIGRDFINPHYEETFDLLSGFGYEAYIAHDNKLKKVDPTVEKDGVFMYLFLHKDTHAQDMALKRLLTI